jgi:hypothetical protein
VILVDTPVWVGHLKGRAHARPLQGLLEKMAVLTHPFVVGELVLGGLPREVRGLLDALPGGEIASHEEVLRLVDEHGLAGQGIGWVDAHLVASARLSGSRIWTLDRQLGTVAARLAIDWSPPGPRSGALQDLADPSRPDSDL